MTVSTEVNQAAYTGNGVTTVFPYTFRILNVSNLVVTQIDLSGNEQLLILGTDYTVSGAGSYSGGAITLPKALPNAYSIIIARELSVVQETDLRNQGTFFAEVHEDAFDYLTMLIQQFRSWIGLSLRRPTIKSNFYDAKQYRIANLADPVNDQDAVNNRSMRDYVEKMIAGVIGGFGWFIQSGTGAIYRTFQSKMRDTVTVEDFGAVGDGIADDTTAIQNALNSGAALVTNAVNFKRYYRITGSLTMTTDNQTLSLNNSEIDMDDSTGLKSHIAIGKPVQMNGPKIKKVVFTNKFPSTVYQITIKNVGAPVIQDCLSYGGGKAFGFVDITRCIVAYIRRNTTDSLIDTAIRVKGIGNDADVAIDVSIYDNRFIGGKHALRWGDYCEGLFFRRNICYAQTDYQLVIEPSSADVAKLSGKIQDNDFDSPSVTKGGIYIQFYKNLQISGNWFANNSLDPMIVLEKTDSVIIQGNQCYPNNIWLSDNGKNTTVSGNLVSGGITHVLYGSSADGSSVMANHMVGASSNNINANNHVGKLSVIGNKLDSVSGGIASPATPVAGHLFLNNSGDSIVGIGKSITLGASPASYTVGSRPEIISFKGGTITNISANNNQMAVSSNTSIGPLPPRTTVSVTYSGATPGVTVMSVM